MTKSTDFFDHIHIHEYAATPKYLQLANSIMQAVESGHINKGTVIPSINEISYHLEIARDTVEKGYKHLKQMGVLSSFPGKGYFISSVDFKQNLKVIVLFNKLSPHKKIIYDTLVDNLGNEAFIDLFIYNNDFSLFKKIIKHKPEEYTHYVIIPHFIDGVENAAALIDELAKDKLVLLDKMIPGITGKFAAVYENFERDIYNVLVKAKTILSKYHTIKLIFPEKSYYPVEIIKGYQTFCAQYAFNSKIVHDIATEPIEAGEVFINLMEDDLVALIERIVSLDLVMGRDVGVISYNETPIKKLILNGITTISTDFYLMGKMAADIILNNSKVQKELPFNLILRPSI